MPHPNTTRICDECGEPFLHRPGRGSANQRFRSQRCQQKNYRRLHPDAGKASRKARDKRNRQKLNAAARVYRALHRDKINAAQRAKYAEAPAEHAARVRESRKQNLERHHAIQRAWRNRHKDKVKAFNARARAALKAKLAEHDRLLNVVGLKFADGLRVSIAAHLLLKDPNAKESKIKTDIYPEEMADRYDSTKKLIERRAIEIDAEKRRISKLSEDDRGAELEGLHKRLRRTLKLPPDIA